MITRGLLSCADLSRLLYQNSSWWTSLRTLIWGWQKGQGRDGLCVPVATCIVEYRKRSFKTWAMETDWTTSHSLYGRVVRKMQTQKDSFSSIIYTSDDVHLNLFSLLSSFGLSFVGGFLSRNVPIYFRRGFVLNVFRNTKVLQHRHLYFSHL